MAGATDNLLTELCPEPNAITDVVHAIQAFFPSGTGNPLDNTVTYERPSDDASLVLRYSKDRVTSIFRGPGLSDQVYDELRDFVEEAVFRSPGTVIGRCYLFSECPVLGYWRHDNHLQILPAPPEAPRPSQRMAPHPFILEFQFRGSLNSRIDSFRLGRAVRRWVRILNALSVCRIWDAPGYEMHWVLTGTDPRTVECRHEGYLLPDPPRLQHWSPTGGYPPLDQVAPLDYYGRTATFGDLRLPSTAADFLDRLARLTSKDSDRFMRACAWLSHGLGSFQSFQSATFVALTNAIEALIPPSTGGTRCDKCGLDKKPGPTALFEAFVNAHLPNDGQIRTSARELYTLRSLLTHGSTLYRVDEDVYSWMRPRVWEQTDALYDMFRIVRLCLHEWLMRR
jgi:hypothetical protein